MPTSPVPPETDDPMHPLIRAGRWVVQDLLSTLIFVALYAATHSIYIAAGLAIAIGVARITYLKFRRLPVDAMQWLSLFLVVVFGGATLLTHDPIFVMLKPSLVHVAIGIVMLRRGWMNRYVGPIALAHAADVTIRFGYAWAALMFATAAANLVVAFLVDTTTWAWFVGVFPILSKVALVVVEYVVTRNIVRRRIRAPKQRLLSVP
jgi:intracellular septation protein A